jgi:hypothetical protein
MKDEPDVNGENLLVLSNQAIARGLAIIDGVLGKDIVSLVIVMLIFYNFNMV